MKEKEMIAVIIGKLDEESASRILADSSVELRIGDAWFPYVGHGMMKPAAGGLVDVPFGAIKESRLRKPLAETAGTIIASGAKKPLFKV